MTEEGAKATKRHLIINAAVLIQYIYIEILSQKICYFGEEIFLLFPQEIRGRGFILC